MPAAPTIVWVVYGCCRYCSATALSYSPGEFGETKIRGHSPPETATPPSTMTKNGSRDPTLQQRRISLRSLVLVAIATRRKEDFPDAVRLVRFRNNNAYPPVSPIYFLAVRTRYSSSSLVPIYTNFFLSLSFTVGYSRKLSLCSSCPQATLFSSLAPRQRGSASFAAISGSFSMLYRG